MTKHVESSRRLCLDGSSILPSSTKHDKALNINALRVYSNKNSNINLNPVSFDTMDKKKFRLFSANNDLSKSWFIDYVDSTGKRKQAKGGINRGKTIEERYKIAGELIEKLEKEVNTFSDTKTLHTLLYNAISLKTIGKRKKTKGSYNGKIKEFLKWCDSEGLKYVHQIDVQKAFEFITFLKNKPLANSTVENYREKLKTSFDIINGLDKNPFRQINPIRFTTKPAPTYKKYEIEKLKKYITENDPQLWLFILFIINCLIRPNSELRVLKVGHIDFEQGLIFIPSDISKNNKSQFVVIPDILMSELEKLDIKSYPPNYFIFSKLGTPALESVGYNYFYNQHRAILRKLNFIDKGYHLYSYKHYGAVTMARNDIPLLQIKEQGRWHSLDQMLDYLRAYGVKDMKEMKKFKGI